MATVGQHVDLIYRIPEYHYGWHFPLIHVVLGVLLHHFIVDDLMANLGAGLEVDGVQVYEFCYHYPVLQILNSASLMTRVDDFIPACLA